MEPIKARTPPGESRSFPVHYHFEHNFGHGHQHLSSTLASLNLIAFLMHQLLYLTHQLFHQVWGQFSSRKSVFAALRVLTAYVCFRDFDTMLRFMQDSKDRGGIRVEDLVRYGP